MASAIYGLSIEPQGQRRSGSTIGIPDPVKCHGTSVGLLLEKPSAHRAGALASMTSVSDSTTLSTYVFLVRLHARLLKFSSIVATAVQTICVSSKCIFTGSSVWIQCLRAISAVF
jgi:hypothetical protein